MLDIKIIYEDGSCGYSSINAKPEDAKNYYEGSYFNVGVVCDKIKKCSRIEILREY